MVKGFAKSDGKALSREAERSHDGKLGMEFDAEM